MFVCSYFRIFSVVSFVADAVFRGDIPTPFDIGGATLIIAGFASMHLPCLDRLTRCERVGSCEDA